MEWSDFRDKKIGLLGAGKENLSLLPWLTRAGGSITLHEQFDQQIPKGLIKQFAELKLVVGAAHLDHLDVYDYLFRAPGLPVDRVTKSLADGSKLPVVTSVTDLFLSIFPGQVIGVTGTKGKGTTATMIGNFLEAAGKQVVVAGNIGRPIFDIFETLSDQVIVVLELSSFQLEDVKHSPNIAVVLPVTEEHLQPLSSVSPNYHHSRVDYVEAKSNIAKFQTVDDSVVFAGDDPSATQIALTSLGSKRRVSTINPQADYFLQTNGQLFKHGQAFFDFNKTAIRGQHFLLDAALAISALEDYITKEDIAKGLANFKTLPHRLELFTTIDGVAFVDDSYATAPDATIAALSAFRQPIILLAGGSSKGVSFSQLAQAVSHSTVIKVLLIGQEAKRLSQALAKESLKIPIEICHSLEEAVRLAKVQAKEGEVVMLSPACASKDMFADAADRGEQFQALVRK